MLAINKFIDCNTVDRIPSHGESAAVLSVSQRSMNTSGLEDKFAPVSDSGYEKVVPPEGS
jgi:hypothetical protein